MALVASEQVKRAVTDPLFHPSLFGAGMRATVMLGGVRSTTNAPLVTEALLPARSVTVPLTVCPAPSDDTSWAGGQAAIPESASLHVKCASTVVL